MSTDDAFRGLADAENDMERNARVTQLQDEVRPYADELVRVYAEYLYRFGNDDAKAFQAMIMFVQIGVEVGKYDQEAILVLAVFMARRLQYHRPRLARSDN